MNRALPATGAALLVGAGLVVWWRRRGAIVEGIVSAPALVPDFGGPLGAELQRAHDNGWDLLFAASERAHGLPPGILAAVASRETNTKNIVGDEGHGRGLMQIDDRSHGAWLKAHGAGDAGAPDVDAAIDYAGGLIQKAIEYARSNAVAEADVLKFALSAYNAGPGNALKGYKNSGDSDAYTTGKNYGADVLARWHKMFPGQGDPVLAPPPAPQIAGGYEPRIGAVEPGLAPAAAKLLEQIDAIWPNRNTASDGAIGDSDEPDHASGNAVDITNDPTNGPDLMALGDLLLGDPRVHYIIFNSRIANRDVQAGAWRPYPEREPDERISDYEARARGYNAHSRHMHISFRRSGRADGSRWPRGAKDNSILARARRAAPLPAPTDLDRLPGLLKQGIRDLWDKGIVDNFRWVPIKIGEYEIEVTADAAAAYGLRMPASFDDVLAMAGSVGDIIPPTKAIVDARWANAAKKIVVPPIPGGAHRADGLDPIGVQQVQQWDAALGPLSTGPLFDGGWKEWVLEPNIQEGHAVNYGLRKDPGGAVWQSPGHAHDADWKDYSQLATFVKRKAKRNGVEVDLLDEIAKGGPLGGPLPQWIVDRLNGGSA